MFGGQLEGLVYRYLLLCLYETTIQLLFIKLI